MIENGESVSEPTAKTAVAAKVFADEAGAYFERLADYEDRVADAEHDLRLAKQIAALASLGALVVGLIGLVADRAAAPVVGVLIGVAGLGYAGLQYQRATDRIETARAERENDEPRATVSFVSQVAVPLYLQPYDDGHYVFDGLDAAPETTLDLANLDGDALDEAVRTLETRADDYQELAEAGVADPEAVTAVAPDAEHHRHPERPLVETLREATSVVEASDSRRVDAPVWSDDRQTESVRELLTTDLAVEPADSQVRLSPERSQESCRALVDDVRGIESAAVDGDVLDRARQSRDVATSVTRPMVEQLQTAAETVHGHCDARRQASHEAVGKFVCEECLASAADRLADEFDLAATVVEDSSAFGAALTDPDLNEATDEAFTESIRDDVAAKLPKLDDRLQAAYADLSPLASDSDQCETHGDVSTVRVERSGDLFGEVWRSLYVESREPILQRVDELGQEAEDIRRDKERRMNDLIQYEQMRDQAERRFLEAESEYQAARSVEESV